MKFDLSRIVENPVCTYHIDLEKHFDQDSADFHLKSFLYDLF